MADIGRVVISHSGFYKNFIGIFMICKTVCRCAAYTLNGCNVIAGQFTPGWMAPIFGRILHHKLVACASNGVWRSDPRTAVQRTSDDECLFFSFLGSIGAQSRALHSSSAFKCALHSNRAQCCAVALDEFLQPPTNDTLKHATRLILI